MKALILQHVSHEGPGTLGSFLEERGAGVLTTQLYRGDELPRDPREADLIVSMGGPMNVYEDVKHPFLARETGFIAKAVKEGVPVVGICLGAQIIARACDAPVYRSPVKEVGWSSVSLTGEGRRDTLFEGLPDELEVLQWHEDTFDVPDGGTLLATSRECPNQAFRVGNAFGLQFHIEVDAALLGEWFSDSPRREQILNRYRHLRPAFDERARRIYEKLVALAENRR